MGKLTLKQDVKMRLVTSLLSSPITYVPHYHFGFIDEVLQELCHVSPTQHRLMDIDSLSILEYDPLRNKVRDFATKEIHEYYDDFEGMGRWLEYLAYPGVQPPTLSVDKPVICLFKNLFESSQGIQLQSFLLTFAANYRPEKGLSILIVDPTPTAMLPEGIRDVVSVVDIPRPGIEDVEILVRQLPISRACEKRKEKIYNEISRNLQGLELYEVQQIIRSTLIRSNYGLNDNSSGFTLEEKRRILQKSGIIEMLPTETSFDDIGGLERLREDISRSARLYAHIGEVEESDLPLPKGVLLLGMPGCGKSLIAKATAKEFGVPLLRLDVSRLMGKYVGQSEANLRNALATAEAAHPCVLWIDEIEKAFSGAGSANGESDMLVMRMMGHFLTWMQERKTAVYIVATANDALRSEFMRKGRFDQVYFVDFPSAHERLEILKKKLGRYRISSHIVLDESLKEKGEVLKNLAEKKMDRFSGAEIEYVVNEVMSIKISNRIKTLKEGEELGKVEVVASDFEAVIKDQVDSILNQKDKTKCQQSISNIRKLYETYRFPNASSN